VAGDGARRAQVAFLRHEWDVVALVAVMVLVVDVCVLLALPPLPAGIALGVFDASVAWWGALAVVHATGTGPRWMGGQLDEWTAEELQPLEALGWRHVDHVQLQLCDVDEVVVGPGGTFAVETMWRPGRWLTRRGDGVGRAVKTARVNARDIRLRLAAHGVRAEVHPVVVVWGGGAPDVRDDNGVTVLPGTSVRSWFCGRPPVLGCAEVDRVAEALAADRVPDGLGLHRRQDLVR
jgi:hypothetical protein